MATKQIDEEFEDESVPADMDAVVDLDGERLTVGALVERYTAILAERDALADAVSTFGLQPPKPAAPVVKRPEKAPHGSLNPTDGRSGRTTKVTE